jgi:hypothetical protein
LIQRRVVKCAADGSVVSEYFDDISWEQVRSQRDQALANSDWRALKDVTLPNAWKEYRQALRDLGGFDSANDAADNWPQAPE